MNGEKFYEYLQDLIIHGNLYKIKSDQFEYGSTIELRSRQCMKPGEHPYFRDLPYHLIVKITLTWFRRIQNLMEGFLKADDVYEFFTGFNIYYMDPNMHYQSVCLVTDDEEMALSLIRYLIPKLIEEGEQKNPIGIALRFIKGFEHLKPDIIRYYKEMYHSN